MNNFKKSDFAILQKKKYRIIINVETIKRISIIDWSNPETVKYDYPRYHAAAEMLIITLHSFIDSYRKTVGNKKLQDFEFDQSILKCKEKLDMILNKRISVCAGERLEDILRNMRDSLEHNNDINKFTPNELKIMFDNVDFMKLITEDLRVEIDELCDLFMVYGE
jgi:hypothetical protein